MLTDARRRKRVCTNSVGLFQMSMPKDLVHCNEFVVTLSNSFISLCRNRLVSIDQR